MLAWLAWLLLAVTPVYGAPAGATGDAHAPGQTQSVSSPTDHAMHAMSSMAGDCCTGPSLPGHEAVSTCQCAAMCAGVLPVPAMVALAAPILDATPVPQRVATAPSVTHSPPLRPPLSWRFNQT